MLQVSTSAARPIVSGTRPSASIMGETLRPMAARTRSLPLAPEEAPAIQAARITSNREHLVWPVILESHDEALKMHCKHVMSLDLP